MFDSSKVVDLAAERTVLTGMYIHGEDGFLDVSDLISTPSSFTDPANQALFNIFTHLYRDKEMKNLDEASVAATAQHLGYSWLFTKPDDVNHLRTILNGKVLLENVRNWAARVEKLSITRQLMEQLIYAGKSLEDIRGDEPIEHILGLAETPLFDFSNRLQAPTQNQPELLGKGMKEHLLYLMNNPVEQVGIPSGYSYYDNHIGGGFRRRTVSLLGARTGVGKSMVSLNIAKFIAKNYDIPVLYLDTEMINEDHWYRLAANMTNQTINSIETGKVGVNQSYRESVLKACDEAEKFPFHYLNVSGKPFQEIISTTRRWIMKEVGRDEEGRTKDCLIIYDYMKLMSGDGIAAHMQEYQMLGFMMTSLHNFAVRYDVPIFSLVQLNRDGIDKEDSAAVSGSDRIVWLATNLAIFKPKSDDEIANDGEENGTHKIVVVKARHGGGTKWGDYINYKVEGKYAQIIELETRGNLVKSKEDKFSTESDNTVELENESVSFE